MLQMVEPILSAISATVFLFEFFVEYFVFEFAFVVFLLFCLHYLLRQKVLKLFWELEKALKQDASGLLFRRFLN